MRLFIAIVCLTTFLSCIEQIEFPVSQDENLVVVDGIFTDNLEVQEIRLSSNIEVNSQVRIPVLGANVTVESNDGEVIQFEETSPGIHTVMARADRAKKYRLKAVLADSREITSNFQSVPDALEISEITHRDTMRIFVNESGKNQRVNYVEFFANIEANSIPNDLFLRFSSKTVYQVLEDRCGPFHVPKTCYFYNDRRVTGVNILSVEKSEGPVRFKKSVHQREIDYSMAELFALDLQLLSYNEEEYAYWSQLKRIFDQTGLITDTAPARLRGNIKSQDGTEVLGQFAVVGKTRDIKLIGGADVSTPILPYCGFAGNRPFPRPTECCNCLALNGATTVRPRYWP